MCVAVGTVVLFRYHIMFVSVRVRCCCLDIMCCLCWCCDVVYIPRVVCVVVVDDVMLFRHPVLFLFLLVL